MFLAQRFRNSNYSTRAFQALTSKSFAIILIMVYIISLSATSNCMTVETAALGDGRQSTKLLRRPMLTFASPAMPGAPDKMPEDKKDVEKVGEMESTIWTQLKQSASKSRTPVDEFSPASGNPTLGFKPSEHAASPFT